MLVSLVFAAAFAQAPPFVVGGQPAESGAWPDVAAVLYGGIGGCTGTLIAPDLVLTAAHCADSPVDAVKLDSTNWVLEGLTVEVIDQIVYPNWQVRYDAAVLVLAEAVDIPPRRIARGCIVDEDLLDGAPVALVGFGATNASGQGLNVTLHEAVTEITDHDCTSLQLGCNALVSPGGELIAGGDGVDTCFGDSGGPVYLLTARGDYLAGVTSRTFFDPGENPCNGGGIYVRPDALIDWIEDETGRVLAEEICGYPPAPTVPAIVIERGRRGLTDVFPNDLDAGDGHSFAIGVRPVRGTASVDRHGRVRYRADRGFTGDDPFTVVVTDDSEWALATEAEVGVTVVAGGACNSGGGPPSAWWLALAAMAWERRRVHASPGTRFV